MNPRSKRSKTPSSISSERHYSMRWRTTTTNKRKQAVRRGSGDLGGGRSGGLAEPEAAHAPQPITQLGEMCKGLQPLGNRLLLKAVPAPDKIGSLWMPPSAQQEYTICQAEIVACGAGV